VIASQSTLAIIGFAEIAIAVTQCVYCCTTIYGPFRNEDAEMVCLSIWMRIAYCSIWHYKRLLIRIRANEGNRSNMNSRQVRKTNLVIEEAYLWVMFSSMEGVLESLMKVDISVERETCM